MKPRRPALSVEQLESREVPAGLSPQAADNVVTGLYHQLLHRDPTAPELTRLSDQLEAGVPARRVANQLWSTSEFHGLEVTAYFGAYFGQTPRPAAKAAYVALLDAGVPEAEVMTRLLASPRFSARYTTDADYATGLFQVLFDRTPGTTELNAATAALTAGTSRADLAASFLDSAEFRTRRVRGMLTAALGRTPGPALGSVW